MKEIALILTDTSRSRVYFSMLIKNKLIPKYILYLKDTKKKFSFGNQNIHDYNKRKINLSKSFKKLNIKAIIHLDEEIKKLNIEYDIFSTTNIHNKKIMNKLKSRKEKIFIYSGYPGVILNKEILEIKKLFLHVHGGYLPKYKGSTTNYYSILKENKIGATSIFMSNKLDSGPILLRREFVPPKQKEMMDHLYDNYFRAKVLVETLNTIFKNSKILKNSKKTIKSKSDIYFVIHPVLKHISILR